MRKTTSIDVNKLAKPIENNYLGFTRGNFTCAKFSGLIISKGVNHSKKSLHRILRVMHRAQKVCARQGCASIDMLRASSSTKSAATSANTSCWSKQKLFSRAQYMPIAKI
jgi:hypothetical protein